MIVNHQELPSESSSNYAAGMLLGLSLGMIFGWLIFDNIGIGLCFGAAFGPLFTAGASGYKKISRKNEKKE